MLSISLVITNSFITKLTSFIILKTLYLIGLLVYLRRIFYLLLEIIKYIKTINSSYIYYSFY